MKKPGWIARTLIAGTLITGIGVAVFMETLPTASAASGQDFVQVTKGSGNVQQVSAQVTIDAPPTFVWQTMTQYADFQNYMPGYKESRVISSQGGTKTLALKVKVSSLLPSYQYQVKVQEDLPAQRIRLNRISGDFKQLDGTYQLRPQGNSRTTLIYTLTLDPGTPLPGAEHVLKANTEKSLAAFRQRAEASHQRNLIGKK